MARQTPSQYLQHNEHVIFDPTRAPPLDTSCSDISNSELNENGKRLRSPDRSKENGIEGQTENTAYPAKRAHAVSPTHVSPGSTRISSGTPRVSPGSIRASPGSLRVSPSSTGVSPRSLQASPAGAPLYTSGSAPVPPLRLEDMSVQREMRERTRNTDRIDRQIGYSRGENYDVHLERVEDEWKHLENMLHCVMDMVGRCRQALTALQERTRREREDLARWVRHQNGVDPEVKKRADYMTESLRHTEDKVSEVRRRAVHVFPEDAVNEVKRQAMLELQKAVAAAEVKANELVASERAKLEKQLCDVTKQAREEVMEMLNRQEESSESCWNCGRKANETCSGCNTARYCGSFCQHKDWENHHRLCGQAIANRVPATSPHHGQSSSANHNQALPVSHEHGQAVLASQRLSDNKDNNIKLPPSDNDSSNVTNKSVESGITAEEAKFAKESEPNAHKTVENNGVQRTKANIRMNIDMEKSQSSPSQPLSTNEPQNNNTVQL